MRRTTLCFLIREGEILLALKKRGFGEGKWNGVGGKVEIGETIEKAITRETHEEIGVLLREVDLEKRAVLTFIFPDNPAWDQECHVFFVRRWNGEPIESEEMRPQWFPASEIPFDQMWNDDPFWLPLTLKGERIKGTFHFSAKQEVISHTVLKVNTPL